MGFLSWGLSQFIIQTVLHSVIIVIVVEAMIRFWHIQNPSLQIKFSFLALLLPVTYLPLCFLFYFARTGAYFHEQVALIDSAAWMGLRLVGEVTIGHLFVVLLFLTLSFFFLGEVIPGIKHFLPSNPNRAVQREQGCITYNYGI